ncbi:MAG: ribonuclease R [Candidatus Paceibacterota bacterium]|jgi:ribonuclease R
MKNEKKKFKHHKKEHGHNKDFKTKEIEGFLSITGKGFGYVRPRDIKPGTKDFDIEIDPAFLNTGLHGDEVKVLLHPKIKNKQQNGEVVSVLKRSKAGFSGILQKENDIFYLIPSDFKMYADIIIPKEKIGGAKIGQKVFVEITDWKDVKKPPQGEVVKVLGEPGENDAEMQAIALEKGFRSEFPNDVEKEAERLKLSPITNEEINKRRDLRKVTTFTIDPEDAKDFDDAISVRELDSDPHHGGASYEIGVHIADVSHYVRKGTILDKEADKRGTSVYLVDRTIPMLPEILSNDLCSLRSKEQKLTFSAIFTMTKSGEVVSEWFGKTIIDSDKRFTYEEAQEILNKKEGIFYKELSILNSLAKKLTKKRFEEGAISLDQEEVKFLLDEKGVPIKVYKKLRQDTNKLVEEFMLLANRKVAEFMSKNQKEKIFVYRVHDLPDKEKIQNLVIFLKKLGYQIKTVDGIIPAYEINRLIEELEGKEEKNSIHTAIIRSMAKAVYSTKNIGHFGLAFKYYTHFTSPIRRYPDVIVHRLLDDCLKKVQISKEKWKEYEDVSVASSAREKEASDAERASIKYKQAEYMSYRIGQTFDGVITGVTEWGIYAEEKETKCEGMIKLRDLGNDFYVYDEKQMEVTGKKTKKRFRLGDKVKIKVLGADMNKKTIDYIFV